MSTEIVNIEQLDLASIQVPEHPCIPDLTNKREEMWTVIEDERLLAVCALWAKDTPEFKAYKTGLIGDFFCLRSDAGEALLQHVSSRLKELGCNYVIGPMNGDTWHSYRLVTEPGEWPPFFMEYFTPKEWPAIFTNTGFKEIAGYSSAMALNTDYDDRSAEKFMQKKQGLDLVIRPFRIEHSVTELTAVHELSLQSFSSNFLYSEILQHDFLKLYEKIVPYVDPDFFLLAEHHGKLVGFIFAVPDFMQRQRGLDIDCLIIKTVAKIPGRQYAGLGNYLVHEIHRQATAKGFKQIIHALMYDSNVSMAISGKSAQTMRKYALYGKELTQW